MNGEPFRIAQISDLHVRAASDKAANEFDSALSKCLDIVRRTRAGLVIATGDLTQSGDEEEYRRFRELMGGLAIPYYVLPGNHDNVTALRAVFNDCAYLFENPDHVSYAVDAGPLRVLALDSTKHRRAAGYLDSSRLDWLRSCLGRDPSRPALLAMHHPPFAAGVWPLDWLGFAKLDELAAIVQAHPQIKRIASGHVHCARAGRFAGAFACTSPSTRPQCLIVGVGWRLPALHLERPGFLVHELSTDGRFRTNVHRIDGTVESFPASEQVAEIGL